MQDESNFTTQSTAVPEGEIAPLPGSTEFFKGSFGSGEMVVVVFDLRSSTHFIHELTSLGSAAIARYDRMIGEIKRHLNRANKSAGKREFGPWFELHKFLGDGWILLFPTAHVNSGELLPFMRDLTKRSYELLLELKTAIELPPPSIGVSFGIAYGTVSRIQVNGKSEAIGRPINLACRLQKYVTADNAACVTTPVFDKYMQGARRYQYDSVSMKGINAGNRFPCVVIDVLADADQPDH